jgi:hypothetical protein
LDRKTNGIVCVMQISILPIFDYRFFLEMGEFDDMNDLFFCLNGTYWGKLCKIEFEKS